jgi:CRP-like cAMP-binding protein
MSRRTGSAGSGGGPPASVAPTSPAVAAVRDAGFGWVLETTFLAQLSPVDQERFLAVAAWRTFSAGQVLLAAGAPGTEVLLVVRGTAVVRRAGRDGSPTDVATVGPGALLGERSIARNTPVSAQIQAIATGYVLAVPRAAFLALLATSEPFRSAIDQLIELRDATPDLLELLVAQPLFRAFGRTETERFVSAGRIVTARAGERIITAGARDRDVYVLIRGRVAVFAPGTREQLASGEPGWMFGHAAALLGTARTADVEAEEASTLLVVGASTLMEMMAQSPASQRRALAELVGPGVKSVPGEAKVPRAGHQIGLLHGPEDDEGAALGHPLARSLGPNTHLVLAETDRWGRRLLDGHPSTDAMVGGIAARRLRVAGGEVIVAPDAASRAQILGRLREEGAATVVPVAWGDGDAVGLAETSDAIAQVRPAGAALWSASRGASGRCASTWCACRGGLACRASPSASPPTPRPSTRWRAGEAPRSTGGSPAAATGWRAR